MLELACGSRSISSVFFFAEGDSGSEIDGGGGLPHAALLIGNGQDGGHRVPARIRGWARASLGRQPTRHCGPLARILSGAPNLTVQACGSASKKWQGPSPLGDRVAQQACWLPRRDLGHAFGK